MSETNGFEPKIVAFVCNWCTYLGADLAGTNRLEYPPNVRILRLPCTGRIDFNLIVKAFEMNADAVLVSGCHPGDCHYSAGNYHARRRWMLFRPLLDALGFDMRRIHFTLISAAEGKKFQQVIGEITGQTRALGPYRPYEGPRGPMPAGAAPPLPGAAPDESFEEAAARLRESARRLLSEGQVEVVIGYDQKGFPLFVTKAEHAGKLSWNSRCLANLTVYLKRKEIRVLGKPAIVMKACDERSLVVLEKESQITGQDIVAIQMPCPGLGEPKCAACQDRQPAPPPVDPAARWARLDRLMAMTPEQRLAYWTEELDRCVKCYACRQVCPLCYCNQCIVDKNRPTVIDTSATLKGNFAWQITRTFHLAARCTGCGECTRACPAGIDLGLLNQSVGRACVEQFGYRPGASRQAEPVFGSFSFGDKEDFIR